MDEELAHEVHELRGMVEDEEQVVRADHRMLAALADVRLELAKTKGGQFDNERTDASYAQAFRDYGINVLAHGGNRWMPPIPDPP